MLDTSKKICLGHFYCIGTNGVRMIKAINDLSKNNINFSSVSKSKKPETAHDESEILPNTLKTRIAQKYQKTANAFLEYPVKGLKGDVNSDFYEFLSMGIIPYLAGSAMFMTVFNVVNKHLHAKQNLTGKKMGLGVVLYGLGKTMTGDLVTRPVHWNTGVDVELPYQNVIYPLPKEAGDKATIMPQYQQQKVFDSKEFFRKDLIQKHPDYGVAYYDKIAKKLGLGENLNDSVTETTPIIQSIISTTKVAKSLSTYAWAGVGVALAMQDSWKDFFDTISNRRQHIKKPNESILHSFGAKLKNTTLNTIDISKSFVKSFGKSCKNLWTGSPKSSGFKKHAGKSFILGATALTIATTLNVIYRAKNMGKLANKEIIDSNKESTVI